MPVHREIRITKHGREIVNRSLPSNRAKIRIRRNFSKRNSPRLLCRRLLLGMMDGKAGRAVAIGARLSTGWAGRPPATRGTPFHSQRTEAAAAGLRSSLCITRNTTVVPNRTPLRVIATCRPEINDICLSLHRPTIAISSYSRSSYASFHINRPTIQSTPLEFFSASSPPPPPLPPPDSSLISGTRGSRDYERP